MLTHISISDILFLDIETAPCVYRFDELSEQGQELWSKKTRFLQQREEASAEELYERAGIYAEFSKVICATVGYIAERDGKRSFRMKSFSGHDEVALLKGLKLLLARFFKNSNALLCAHNGKEFDFPFLARRYVINRIALPEVLDLAGKKPWEVSHLDTMNLWKFGDYKHYTSVELLAYTLGIESPKDDISGADVGRVYHEEDGLERITTYCEKDVVTIAQVMLAMKRMEQLTEDEIERLS